jgi:hypothetical protein
MALYTLVTTQKIADDMGISYEHAAMLEAMLGNDSDSLVKYDVIALQSQYICTTVEELLDYLGIDFDSDGIDEEEDLYIRLESILKRNTSFLASAPLKHWHYGTLIVHVNY